MDCSSQISSVHGVSSEVGCQFLLQGIFLTQVSNLGLLHWRQVLYHLSHQGSLCLHLNPQDLWILPYITKYDKLRILRGGAYPKWILNSITCTFIRWTHREDKEATSPWKQREEWWRMAWSHLKLEEAKNGFFPEPSEPVDTKFWFLVSETVRGQISDGLSHPLCGNLL